MIWEYISVWKVMMYGDNPWDGLQKIQQDFPFTWIVGSKQFLGSL